MTPAFADPPADAARAFRAILDATARPGTVHALPAPAPDGLSPAAAGLLLVLADAETGVHLAGPAEAARGWLRFHTGAPDARPGDCAFAVGPWDALGPLDAYPMGTPDYPDRSATLIVEMPALGGDGPRLTGPGIETAARMTLPDAAALRANAARYPLGVDLFLTCGDRLAALPRSTRIAEDA